MNSKLLLSGLICAVLLSACSSPPKLTEPSGKWVDVNPPVSSVIHSGGHNAASQK